MGKYLTAEADIWSIFGSLEWQAEEVKAYPVGYEGEKGPVPYVRLSIVPSGPPLNSNSSSGILLVEIFTAWGEGPRSATIIADKLDTYLQRKTIGTTQLFLSSLDRHEKDKDNPSLGRSIYSLPYTHFGVN